MNSYEKLIAKKKKGNEEMSPMVKQAKMGILENLRDMADSQMGEKLMNMKKVSVASDSKEGLASGLEKAKEMIESQADEESSEDESDMEAMDARNHMEEDAEQAAMSEEEINAKLEELMKLKEQLAAKKM